MKSINENIKFLLNLTKVQSLLIKRFDGGIGNGISFNEFLILFYLNQANDQKLRRIDLAEKIGITASGITRILLPMEKIGLIKSNSVSDDARTRIVSLSSGGKQKFDDALERLNFFLEEIFFIEDKKIKDLSEVLIKIGGKIFMN